MASQETHDKKANVLENPLSNAPQAIIWEQVVELGYDEPSDSSVPTICFGCSKRKEDLKENEKFSTCAKCHVANYCSRDCQIKDWKQGRHKLACSSYSRLREIDEDLTVKETVRNELFARIRFYACPYAVHRTPELGNGFLFIQSDSTLRDLSIPIPRDAHGRTMETRSILMHFLTLGEYDAELCRDDFEMAVVRGKLQELISNYDEEKEVVCLMRLRCGHMAVGKAILVPDYRICKKLGQDYYADNTAGVVQLNLDDL